MGKNILGITLRDIGSFATGAIERDRELTAQAAKDKADELKANRDAILAMKAKRYDSEIKDFEEQNTKYKAIKAVNDQFEGKEVVPSEWGETYLRTTDASTYNSLVKQYEDDTEGLKKAFATYYNPKFTLNTTRDAIENKTEENIKKINTEYNNKIKNARGDSFLIAQLLGEKNKKINTIEKESTEDSQGIKLATEINKESITTEPNFNLKEEEFDISYPKKWKEEYRTQKIEANKIDYSSKEYSKKISDTVLTLIPNAETKNYFELDKDNKITSAKSPIINADITIQSLINNSLDDITMKDTFNVTGKDITKINFSVNQRFQIAKNHVEDYGMWMADGKVLGDSGSLKNLFKKESTALIVPSNSIININNNKLKGYENVFNTIDKELRQDVGKVYKNFIVEKAEKRMTKEGGTLEENINFLQRQLENDNNGNESLTKETRDFIAQALLKARKTNGELYYSDINKKISENIGNKVSSTMDTKQNELSSGADIQDFSKVRKIIIKDKVTGQDTSVPLTTKNMNWLRKNYPEVDLSVKQDTTTGDGNIIEQTSSKNKVKKITPQNVGIDTGINFFTKLSDIKKILPNDMTGKEIKEKYNIDFPINDFTIYKPTK